MDTVKYIIALAPSFIFIILGVCVKYFKMYWMISGYNLMSAEKKKNVDVKGLGAMMANFCFVLAGIIFVFIISLFYKIFILSFVAVGAILSVIIYIIIKSQRYDGNAVNKDGTMKKKTKIFVGFVIAFLLIVFTGVGIMIFQSNKPVTYIITDDKIEIISLYGETINFKDIDSVSMIDKLPDIKARTNGSAIGSILKGYFNVDQYGNVKLFADMNGSSFIVVNTGGRTIIFNAEDQIEIQDLFDKIISWQKMHP